MVGTSLCKTISIVSLLCFSALLDCIAVFKGDIAFMMIFVNDVYCLMKQASFSCGRVAGHSMAAGPGEITFLKICCIRIDFCNHSKILNHSAATTTP